MTKAETAKILTYLLADFDQALTPAKVEVWHDQIQHLTFEMGMVAARVLMGRKMYGTPKVADFLDAVKEITRPERNETWGEAFDKWLRIARSYGYYRKAAAIERYKAECPQGYRALGTMANEYFDLKTEELPTFRAQFRQRYEAIEQREERLAALPPQVSAAIAQITGIELKRIGDGGR